MEERARVQIGDIVTRREFVGRLAVGAVCAAAGAFMTESGVSPLSTGLVCGFAMAGVYPVAALMGGAFGSLIFFRWHNLVLLALYSLTQLGWGVVRPAPERREKLLLMAAAGVLTLPMFWFASLDAVLLGFAELGLTLLFGIGVRLAVAAVRALMNERLLDDRRQAGLCLTAAMAVAATAGIDVLSVSPAAILAAAAALYAVMLRGAAGVGAAVVFGIARVFGGGASMLFVANLAACAMGAAALRNVGKWGVAAGFAATGAVLSVYVGGSGTLSLWEVLLSMMPFVLLPDRYMDRLTASVMDRASRRDRDRLMFLQSSMRDAAKVMTRVAALLAAAAPIDGRSHKLTAAGFAGMGGLMERLVEERPVRRRDITPICGVAGIAKEGSAVSGDTATVRSVMGKLLLLISDGMGSGEAARRESAETVALLGDLLAVGFEAEQAMETVNSVLLMSRLRETYATVDAALIDMTDGECRFIKSAAPPSYIIRQGRAYPMAGDSLPTGILLDAAPAVHTSTLRRGDRLVMLTDGVADALADDLLHEVLEAVTAADDAQEAADALIQAARERGRRDDMTVITAFVE